MAAAPCALLLAAVPSSAQAMGPGAVFTATNDDQANAVVAFRRNAAGQLLVQGAYPTGGVGSGGGLGNQGGLVIDNSGQHLFVVNAGDNTVSTFGIGPRGLDLLDMEDSGGIQPISVTVLGDLVYVLHSGGDGSITGFECAPGGTLSPLVGSTRPLSGTGTGPAQIAFTPDGRFLVVTEKATNTIVTYRVGSEGRPDNPVVTPSEGITPFGFSFGHRSRLLVSEATGGAAGQSTVSSYEMLGDGSLQPITSALATTQSAACWLVATVNGRFAYTTNTASNSVTGLTIARDGSLALLQPSGLTASTGNAPIDAALSRDGRYLYVLNAGDDTISAFAISADGSLGFLATVGGLPASVNGLAAL